MTPMVFHAINFSASQVGRGLALSAVVGTVVRLISGALLDRGLRCSWPVRATAILALLADIVLFRANSYSSFMAGEILIGSAAGLYWPAIELAVPLAVNPSHPVGGMPLSEVRMHWDSAWAPCRAPLLQRWEPCGWFTSLKRSA